MQKTDQLPKPTITTSAVNGEPYDLDQIWKIASENIRLYVSKQNYVSWFKGLLLEKIDAGIAEISCSQPYAREMIETYHRSL
jgi:hypothetical protein